MAAKESELPILTMNTGMPSMAMSAAIWDGRRADEKKDCV